MSPGKNTADSSGGRNLGVFFSLVLFSTLPGLALFVVNQAMFIFIRHSSLPLLCAAMYCLTFFFPALLGGALALYLVGRLGEKRTLAILFSALLLAIFTGVIFWIRHTMIFETRPPQVTNSHFLWAAALLAAIFTLALSRKERLGRPARWAALLMTLSVALGWALFFPEQDWIPSPYSLFLTASMLALLAAAMFLLWRGFSFPRYAEAAALSGLLITVFLLHLTGAADSVYSGAAPTSGHEAVHGPNIVFIVLDTVRRDHLSVYGYERETSPFLEEMARSSEVFRRAVSVAPWTPPSHASMFTGLYPRSHSMHYNRAGPDLGIREFNTLPEEMTTLAEILSSRGYRCGAVSANFGWVGRIGNLHQGFEFFDDQRNPLFMLRHFELQKKLLQLAVPYMPPGVRFKYFTPTRPAESINRSALEWLDSIEGEAPFFLFINYMDAHEPYYPPGELARHFSGYAREYADALFAREAARKGLSIKQREHLLSQYDAQIYYLDRQVGALMKGLKQRGLYRGSYIIVTSDHGQFLGERNLVGHGKDLYSQVLDIPLIIKHPGNKIRGVNNGLVENRALFYMVLEQAGLAASPPSYPWDAAAEYYGKRVFKRALGGGRPRAERKKATALYFEGVKYMVTEGGAEELYDLRADPEEKHNLIKSLPRLAEKGRKLYKEFLDRVPEKLERDGRERIGAEEIEALKALGYIE